MEKEIYLEEDLKTIKEFIKAIDNPNRRIILEMCNEKSYKIKEIRDYLKSSNKVILDHLRILKTNALIKTEKKKKERGKPVYVSTKITLLEISKKLNNIKKLIWKLKKEEKNKMKLELTDKELKELKIILYNFLGLSKNSDQVLKAYELLEKFNTK